MKLALALAAGMLLASASPAAALSPATGTIRLNEDPASLHLGSTVTFTWSVTGKLKGFQYPMIVVDCEQGGVTTYVQLDFPDTAFVLGGGSSQWKETGGPADCTATLHVYNGLHSGGPYFLASTPAFHVEG